ncbi:hypothetical protein BOX15_Mlig003105g2 [Macrostomum lignano]|uniref:Serine/threonine-protein phosphatase n=1 Tax=Macrostomum lignano TaxID=282301 RepID=A0A267F6C0_9PLAT|nr:hypothetical protein BOX15_Mlig003105g3 [Macrostomum lignano]PAA69335.1 hypothetical protein BOX15_Mlig003105g2 [Macrostomum lignano]
MPPGQSSPKPASADAALLSDEVNEWRLVDSEEDEDTASASSERLPEQQPPLQSDSNAGNSDPPETVAGLFSRLHNAGLQQRCLPSDFTVQLIAGALATAKSVLLAEPNCLQLAGPIVMFGDLHGEFHSLVKLIEVLGRPPARSYLFLGDYVDRGPLSLETVLYLLLLKALHPRHVFVLRGNHEDRRIYRYFNFEDELIATFGLTAGQNLSNYFNETFCYLPVCAVVNGEIFCCHGGLSPYFNHPRFAASQAELVRRINEPSKPLHFRKSDFIADLLWSDALDIVAEMPSPAVYPSTAEEWIEQRNAVSDALGTMRPTVATSAVPTVSPSLRLSQMPMLESASNADGQQGVVEWMPNPRGCSYVFTKAACFNFLRRHRLNWLIRAHMFVMNGCKFSFEGRCVTLFSAADYAQRYRNTGAVLHIPGSASDGTKFPGRTLRFCKKNLLQCDSRLPENPADWPEEIAVKKSLIR